MIISLVSINLGKPRPLAVGARKMLSAIGKRSVGGSAVAVGRMGLSGDEQADLSLHGGLDKAIYAYPTEHYDFWQTQRMTQGVSMFNETLPPGFMGENLSLRGLLESEVWLGDELHFAHCVLRVTAAREPCGKFNAVMGYNGAARDMALAGCCGFYLAVNQVGAITAGETCTLVAGRRSVSLAQAFAAKWSKHR